MRSLHERVTTYVIRLAVKIKSLNKTNTHNWGTKRNKTYKGNGKFLITQKEAHRNTGTVVESIPKIPPGTWYLVQHGREKTLKLAQYSTSKTENQVN